MRDPIKSKVQNILENGQQAPDIKLRIPFDAALVLDEFLSSSSNPQIDQIRQILTMAIRASKPHYKLGKQGSVRVDSRVQGSMVDPDEEIPQHLLDIINNAGT